MPTDTPYQSTIKMPDPKEVRVWVRGECPPIYEGMPRKVLETICSEAFDGEPPHMGHVSGRRAGYAQLYCDLMWGRNKIKEFLDKHPDYQGPDMNKSYVDLLGFCRIMYDLFKKSDEKAYEILAKRKSQTEAEAIQ